MNPVKKPFPPLSLVAAAILMLTACSSTVQRPAEPATPQSWQSSPKAAVAAAASFPQWKELQDSGLLALQAQVLQVNLDLQVAALRLQSSATALGLNELRLKPSLSASYGGSKPLRSSGPGTVNVGGQQIPVPRNDSWSDSYSVNASVSWEFDLWGRIAEQQQGQRAQHETLRADQKAARLALMSRTAELWWGLGAHAEQLPLVQAQVNHAEEALPLVRARVQEGKLLPVELDRASRRLLDARNRLADVQAERQQKLQELGLLLAEPDTKQVSEKVAQARLPQWQEQTWSQRLQASPAQVLERRPDVQRARLQVDAALAAVKGAQAARYPSLNISGGLSSNGQTFAKLLDQPLGSLSSSLFVPLIDWRRLELDEARNRTELELAALQLRDAFNKALNDVELRWVEADRLLRQRDAQEAALKEAQANEALARLRFEVGALSRADWLQTRDALLLAQQQVVQLRLNSWLNQSAFVKAIGGAE